MDNYNTPKTYTKLDTFSETIYMVKLAGDPKAFLREDGSVDVVVTFVDTSRFEKHMELWVDARVLRGQADRAQRFRKGDQVMVRGKLRLVQDEKDPTRIRGKIFDAFVSSFVNTSERAAVEPMTPKAKEVSFE